MLLLEKRKKKQIHQKNEEFFTQLKKNIFLEKDTKKYSNNLQKKEKFSYLFNLENERKRKKKQIIPLQKSLKYDIKILKYVPTKKNKVKNKIELDMEQKQIKTANLLKQVKGGFSLDLKGLMPFIPHSLIQERQMFIGKNYFLQISKTSLNSTKEEFIFFNAIANRIYFISEIRKFLKKNLKKTSLYKILTKKTFEKNSHKLFCKINKKNELKAFQHKEITNMLVRPSSWAYGDQRHAKRLKTLDGVAF